MSGPYPRHHRCPKCDGAVIRRKFNSYAPEGERLDWHCNECGFEWLSRTWDQAPMADECTCWITDRREECGVHPPEKEDKKPGKSEPKSAAEILKNMNLVEEEELP